MADIITNMKRMACGAISLLPPMAAHSMIYYRNHGRWPDWKNLPTYDEKIHWCMANVYDESYARFADKYAVRRYVESCGLGELLLPCYGTYADASEIDYDVLPERFILKATHGSGPEFYEICTDKSLFNHKRASRKMDRALKTRFAGFQGEYQYAGIRPRILCEKLLERPDGARLDDYKVACTNGIAEAVLVCTRRDQGLDYYSREWKHLDYTKKDYQSGELLERPVVLEKMLSAAEVLSKPFPLARVDFYIEDGRLWFGEITLSPAGGNHRDLTELGQSVLGKCMMTGETGKEMGKEGDHGS